jgi:hypothetical protein
VRDQVSDPKKQVELIKCKTPALMLFFVTAADVSKPKTTEENIHPCG